MSTPARVDILVDIRARLDELAKTQEQFKGAHAAAQGFGQMLKQGLGIDFARRGVEMFKRSITDAFVDALRLAKEIDQNARAIGLSGEAYQVFRNELQDAGLEMGRLSMAISTQTESLAQLRRGTGTAVTAYRDLGLVASEMEALSPDQRLLAVARAVHTATDRTTAFSAASLILGRRGLPELLDALKRLAKDGYGSVAEEQKKAGRLMEDTTRELIRQNQKVIEHLRQQRAVAAGEVMGFFTLLARATWNDPLGVLRATFVERYGALDRLLAEYLPALEPTQAPPTGGPAPLLQSQKWKDTSYELTKEQFAQQMIGADSTRSEISTRADLVQSLNREWAIRELLIEQARNDRTMDEDELRMLLLKLEAEQELNRLREKGLMEPRSHAQVTGDAFDAFLRGKDEQGARLLSPGEGAMAGAMEWSMQLGSVGEQIAASLQSTIGTTVSGIGDGIYGWITGTMSWADTLRNMGSSILRTILQTVVQMGVQMILNATLGRMLSKAAAATAVGTAAAMAAPLSALWAAPATLATIATMGGAAAQAPASILAAKGTVLATSFAGFEAGGHTGKGGVVHEDEWVAPKWMVKDPQFGLVINTLEAARNRGAADNYRTMSRRSGGGSAFGGGASGIEPFSGKQRLLVVYTDHSATVEGLKRRPEFETLVLDIGDRNRGHFAG